MDQAIACPLAVERLETIRALLGSPDVNLATAGTLDVLGPDPCNKPRLVEWLRDGAARGERRFEIRSALRAVARAIRPRSYLEIGTRRGWSLAQVLCESPHVDAYLFDLWLNGYGGVENPGPDFVRDEMRVAAPAHRGLLQFFSGNSHDLLPVFLQTAPIGDAELSEIELLRAGEHAPRMFDLVTVDGDHTALGTWWDLADVLPSIAVGGALVIDDLVDFADERLGQRAESRYAAQRPSPSDLEPSLLALWTRLKNEIDNFAFLESLDSIVPVGIAVRMK
jgi:predicted O-methyltransferase YrrM